jgi:hypothetical protein
MLLNFSAAGAAIRDDRPPRRRERRGPHDIGECGRARTIVRLKNKRQFEQFMCLWRAIHWQAGDRVGKISAKKEVFSVS